MFTLRTLFLVVTYAALAAFCIARPNEWTASLIRLFQNTAIAIAAVITITCDGFVTRVGAATFTAFGVVLWLDTSVPLIPLTLYDKAALPVRFPVPSSSPGFAPTWSWSVNDFMWWSLIVDSIAVMCIATLAAFIAGLIVNRSQRKSPEP